MHLIENNEQVFVRGAGGGGVGICEGLWMQYQTNDRIAKISNLQ